MLSSMKNFNMPYKINHFTRLFTTTMNTTDECYIKGNILGFVVIIVATAILLYDIVYITPQLQYCNNP